MTPQEAAALLTVAAAYDNRKPDADAAQAWAMTLDGLPWMDCRDAIVAHYRTSGEWLMPSMVVAAVRKVRDKRIAEVGDLTPPRGLTDEQEREWVGEERRRIGDGLPAREVHQDAIPGRYLPDLRGLMPRPDRHPTPEERPVTIDPRADAARAVLHPTGDGKGQA